MAQLHNDQREQAQAAAALETNSPVSVDDQSGLRELEAYCAALQKGGSPDRGKLLAKYPQIARELSECLEGLDLIREIGPPAELGALDQTGGSGTAAEPKQLGALGDYRILREIGRGGMGIVYEAEQISLHRRVALKVLPFAAVLDPRHLQRFKNEAQAAASLRHPNIVQVFSVGCERGVHYYAMDYVEGQTLAEVIGQLRGARGQGPGARDKGRGARGQGPDASSSIINHQSSILPPHPVTPSPPPAAETSPLAALSTETSTRSPEFFRAGARLGIQAAEALEHAHQMGVVHRDIKPSNLMVEFPLPSPGRGKGAESNLPSPSGRGAGGEGACLWITDFGLARIHTPSPLGGEGRGEGGRGNGASLTMTGDVLGTLRYMSPEQLQAKHGVLDHRTDVYSLGLTLYELLTLQPAFPGDDRQQLIRQITEDDPRPPRQLNKSIPKDLETIILKATAKEPQSRYATAQQFADDLRRYLADEPIRARRPALVERAAKWARRHRWGVATAVAAAFAALLAGSVLFWHGQRREAAERQRAESNLQLALQAMDEVYMESAWESALSLRGSSQQKRLTEPGEMVVRKAMQFYQQFAEFNRGEPSVVIETAKAYKSVGDIRDMLGMHEEATEAWAQAESAVLPILRTRTRQQPKRLAQAYVVLGEVSAARGDNPQAIQYYSQAIQLDPENCDALSKRAHRYITSGMPDAAIGDATEAIRLETSSGRKEGVSISNAYNLRGSAYSHKREYDKAIADYNEALRLLSGGRARDKATTYVNRSRAYREKGELDRAIADCDEAIRLDPRIDQAYAFRGEAYRVKEEFGRAVADYEEAIRLKPDAAVPYNQRGMCYEQMGEFDRALADYQEAIRLDPNAPEPYSNRSVIYFYMGELERAIADCTEAIRLDPNFGMAHSNRGCAYFQKGDSSKALADLEHAIRLDPNEALTFNTRGALYFGKGEFDRAIADFDEAIRLDPRFATAYINRGDTYHIKGQFDRAIADYDKAIALDAKDPGDYLRRAKTRAKLGQVEDALSDVAKALEINPPLPPGKSGAAWLLANCEDPRLRRVDRALELAKAALKQAPKRAATWTTLGAAEYRAGNWQAAVDALQKSNELKYYHVARTGFFLAMAHWQLGQKDEARQWYDKAVEWMEQNQPEDEELRRFRAEAAELLGIENEQRE